MQLTVAQQSRTEAARRGMSKSEVHEFDAAMSRMQRLGVTPTVFGRVLANNCNGHIQDTPEGALWLAVIVSAYDDNYTDWGRHKRTGDRWTGNTDSMRFWFDGRMKLLAGMVGLDDEFVMDTLEACAPWMWQRNA